MPIEVLRSFRFQSRIENDAALVKNTLVQPALATDYCAAFVLDTGRQTEYAYNMHGTRSVTSASTVVGLRLAENEVQT